MQIQLTLHPKKKHKTLENKATDTAVIMYMQTVSGDISRLLAE
jgi:hypothetical protein